MIIIMYKRKTEEEERERERERERAGVCQRERNVNTRQSLLDGPANDGHAAAEMIRAAANRPPALHTGQTCRLALPRDEVGDGLGLGVRARRNGVGTDGPMTGTSCGRGTA